MKWWNCRHCAKDTVLHHSPLLPGFAYKRYTADQAKTVARSHRASQPPGAILRLTFLVKATLPFKAISHFPSFKNLIARSSTSSLFSRIPSIVGLTSMCGTRPIL
jgi:hypothetical protein